MVTLAQNDLAPERQEKLREFVRQRGVARVDEIIREPGVSPAQISRDWK